MAKATNLGRDEKGRLFLQFLLELLESQALLDEFYKYVHDPDAFKPAASRRILGELISDSARPTLKQEMTELSKLVETQNAQLSAIMGELSRTNSLVAHLASDRLQIETLMSMTSEALKRYKEEYFAEKREIAKHLVKCYFTQPLNCFFQASTTVFHLVEELPADKRLLSGTVIHSNSFALPYFVLGQQAFRACNVYPVCGQVKDYKCCGWLYDSYDTQADNYLRDVGKKVDVAFITPQYMDASGYLYFAREQTVNLMQAICETAKRIVVLTPAARVVCDEQALPSPGEISWTRFQPQRDQIELIAAGVPQNLTDEAWAGFQALYHSNPSNRFTHLTI